MGPPAVVAERRGVDDRSAICWLLPAAVEGAGADVMRRAMR